MWWTRGGLRRAGNSRVLAVRRYRGKFHGAFLAGDRLADAGYEPVPIEAVGEGVFQGYSRVLNLLIRWDHGQLGWHDPETGQHVATFEEERARTDTERGGRMATEDRIRELEEELEQHQTN